MTLRDRITETAGQQIQFLPSYCDSFLLGYATRGGHQENPVACYGYQAAKVAILSKYKDPRRAYAEIGRLLNTPGADDCLWLYRYKRSVLWDLIQREQYKTWESLHTAVIGVGYKAGEDDGVVYNRALCIDIMSDNIASSDKRASSQLDAINFLENSVMSIDLQEHTPWFLTHIK